MMSPGPGDLFKRRSLPSWCDTVLRVSRECSRTIEKNFLTPQRGGEMGISY